MTARVIGVANPKGGVGKTTVALNLATYAARCCGWPVLLVDTDPNRSAVDAAESAGDRMPFDLAAETRPEQLRRLRDADHRLVVVDLPGTSHGPLHAAVLGTGGAPPLADALVLPSRPALMDLRPLLRMLDGDVARTGLPYLIALVRVHRDRVAAARDRRQELRDLGYRVADTLTRSLIAHDDALESRRPLMDLPGGSHSAAAAADREYRSLAVEALALAGLHPTDLTAA